MTREEAIKVIKNYENYPHGLSKKCRDYIIKTLEQNPTTKASITMMRLDYEARLKANTVAMLDVIRSEIRLEKLGYPPSAGYYQAIEKVLQIIDKYKAESEPQESEDK